MYKSSLYSNKFNHYLDDYLTDDNFIVESEYKKGHEKYQIPRKTYFTINNTSLDHSHLPSNNTYNNTLDKNVPYSKNLGQNNFDCKTVFNHSILIIGSEDIQTVLKEKLSLTKSTIYPRLRYIENEIEYGLNQVNFSK